MTMTDQIHPFSNATQAMDWSEGNCMLCKHIRDHGGSCALEWHLARASIIDGLIPREIGERIGLTGGGWPVLENRCREFEAVEVGPESEDHQP